MSIARAVLHGSETGPLDPVPLTEDSPLRTKLQTYPPQQIKFLQSVFGWLDDQYDKIPVEHAVMSDPALPGTVLRLPMIYGPGDRLHRFFPVLKRIDDRRAVIPFEQRWGEFRSPRGFIGDVAAAIALAATSERAAGGIYNVAEEESFSEMEWAKMIGEADGWHGEVVGIPAEKAPPHLRMPGRLEQHWTASSRRIREELGYREPTPRADAIRETIAWERANPPAQINPAQFDYAAEDAALAGNEPA